MDLKGKRIIAIMGPSGAGKTTLGKKLVTRYNIAIPKHCTTRIKRDDDEDLYRYLNHNEYKELFENNQFLISSGDGTTIKKKYGNFYGILTEDCMKAWEQNDIIILFLSYKDIISLVTLMEDQIQIDIINLTFSNIKKGIELRLKNNLLRNHSVEDISNRIKSALKDKKKYNNELKLYANITIYTDKLNIEQTYCEVCKYLKFEEK